MMGGLRLSRNHTMTEYELSVKPYNQKSRWINQSFKRANFPGKNQVMTPSVRHIVILMHILLYVARLAPCYTAALFNSCELMAWQKLHFHRNRLLGCRSRAQTNVSVICLFHYCCSPSYPLRVCVWWGSTSHHYLENSLF